jgi:hypothetical protein
MARGLSDLQKEGFRKTVVDNYDSFTNVRKVGPCGAIAVALSRLGFGNVVRLYAISRIGEDGQLPPFPSDDWSTENCTRLPHYAIRTPQGEILDISLPPNFELAGYDDEEDLGSHLHEDEESWSWWTEEDIEFWQALFSNRPKLKKGHLEHLPPKPKGEQEPSSGYRAGALA